MLAQGLPDAPDVALGADVLYLIDYGPSSVDCGSAPTSLSTMPRSGGPVQLVTQEFFGIYPYAASGTTFAFAATQARDGCNGEGPTNPEVVIRIDGNAPPKQIAMGDSYQAIATDGTDVYVVGETSSTSPTTVQVLH